MDIGPTLKQKRAVDNILSAGFPTINKAMRAAGYGKKVATGPKYFLAERKGVKKYLLILADKAKKRFGVDIDEKVVERLLDGLDATKLYGKDAVQHPDYKERREYIKQVMWLFTGILSPRGPDSTPTPSGKTVNTQVNFFAAKAEERSAFNDKFREFMNKANEAVVKSK